MTRLRSGGLMTTYACSSACRHCLYRCSPKWPKQFITSETARKNLETIRKLGCRAIHIGGGEPLLRPDNLAEVLTIASGVGVAVEYVETNASWFRTLDETGALLRSLRASGLTTLLVSISPFHNEYIPLYKVKGVLEACRQTGIAVFPWIAEFIADLSVFDERRPHQLEEYQQHFGHDYLARLPRRYWISPGGRALQTFAQFAPRRTLAEIVAAHPHGCSELAETGHFHLDPDGNYIPGLCAGLAIRRDDLGAPLSPAAYPLLTRLYAEGIGALAACAADQYGFTAAEAGYTSKCELCYEIRRYLVVERGVASPELQPAGHYRYE